MKFLHAPVSHQEQNLDTEQGNAMSMEVSCTASGANDEHDHDSIGKTALRAKMSVSIRGTSNLHDLYMHANETEYTETSAAETHPYEGSAAVSTN